MFILSVWFVWLTAVKSIQLASVFNIFSCSVPVCSPTQILSNLSMRCRTLNGHNFFPKVELMGNSPDLLHKECPFQRYQIRLVTDFVQVQSKSGRLLLVHVRRLISWVNLNNSCTCMAVLGPVSTQKMAKDAKNNEWSSYTFLLHFFSTDVF